MERCRRSILVLAICVQMLVIQSARAQWVENGVPLGHEFGSGGCGTGIIKDGDGGAIVLSYVGYGCVTGPIQRIDKYGALCWGEGRDIGAGLITTDNNGGAIVVWLGSGIRAQRVNGYGHSLWPADGVPLCEAQPGLGLSQIAPDGSGGAIVVWADTRSGEQDIYAQRVDSGGNVLWGTNGTPVCTATRAQDYPAIAPTGSDEVVVVWLDNRNAIGWQERGYELYAQKVDSEGNALWTPNGVPVRLGVEVRTYEFPGITTDGTGGAIVTWFEGRSGNYPVLLAQRTNQNGNMLWQTDGAVVCDTIPASRGQAAIASDGVGGAFITWADSRGGSTGQDIYAQRINSNGACLWQEYGVPVCVRENTQYVPKIVADDQGGLIITWAGPDAAAPASSDICAQRIDASGQIQWTLNGVGICRSGYAYSYSLSVTSDGDGGVIASWLDFRNPSQGQAYAMRVDQDGNAPPSGIQDVPVSWSLSQNYPNPFNPSTTISFTLPRRMTARLAIYSVEGRLLRTLVDGNFDEGYKEVPWDGRDARGGEGSSGVYFYRLTAGDRTLTKKMILLK